MALSLRQFANDLYDEHVEESAFLYELLVGSREDLEFPWVAARDFERRREAHVDALLVGGDAALARALAALEDGPGAIHTASAVLLRSSRHAELHERLATLELAVPEAAEEPDKRVTAIEALRDAVVEHASDAVLAKLLDTAPVGAADWALIGTALGVERRGLVIGSSLLHCALAARFDALRAQADDAPPIGGERRSVGEAVGSGRRDAALFALLGGESFSAALDFACEDPSATLRHAAIEGLFSAKTPRALERLRTLARPGAGNLAALTTGAGLAFAGVLRAASRTAPDADALLALGLHGTPECVAPLLSALESAHAEAAAVALHAITGAVLEETVFEPEPVDEDALFDDELDAWRRDGTAPTRVDGEPWGENREILSTDPARWRAWLEEHAGAFSRGVRYRQGMPISPRALLFALRREHTPHAVRRYSAMELRVRHGLGGAFDVAQPVEMQLRHLEKMRAEIGGGGDSGGARAPRGAADQARRTGSVARAGDSASQGRTYPVTTGRGPRRDGER